MPPEPIRLTPDQAMAAVGRVIRVVEGWECAARIFDNASATAAGAYAAEIRKALQAKEEIKPFNFLPSVRHESDLPPNPANDSAIMVLTSEPGASLGYTEPKLFVAVGGEWKEVLNAS